MKRNSFLLFLGFWGSMFLISCSEKKQEADLIIHNAVIYTVDSSFSVQQAMAIKDGKIIETGSNEQILDKFTSKETNDLGGKTVFPGFIDAHCHFMSYGLGLQQVDLVGTKSFEEVIQRVKDFDVKRDKPKTGIFEGDWIVGRGWDQNDWEVKEYPNKRILDSLFPNTPVILKRIDGHAALANSAALGKAGIYVWTEVNGGEIEKEKSYSVDVRFVPVKTNRSKKDTTKLNSNGCFSTALGAGLTGILIDNAVDLVTSKIPLPTKEKMFNALLAAQENCVAAGLTTVDDAGLMNFEIDAIGELQKNGKLKMRVYAMLSDSAPNYKQYLEKGPYKTDRLNVRSFKFYADGALGSRGACLLDHYSDKKAWKGFLLNTKEHFEKRFVEVAEKGFQINTHSIGDSSFRLVNQILEESVFPHCIEFNPKKKEVEVNATVYFDPSKARNRIEHSQVTDKKDLNNLKARGTIPSIQPTHATSDMYWAEERLGKERVKYAYAYKDLLKAAGLVALGTDFPVEDISPFKTFYAAVFRKDSKGFPKGGFQMENALTREETIKGMTTWAAYSNFEEKEKGSLEKGKFADFVILDTDLMKCDESKVLQTQVLQTYINGESVFKRSTPSGL